MPILIRHNMGIPQISSTISAWKRCSIPLCHHFCCSGSCLLRKGEQFLSHVTAKRREYHQIWKWCWTSVQVNEYKYLLVFVKFKTCIVLDYWICSWTRNQLAIQHYKNYHNNFSGLFSFLSHVTAKRREYHQIWKWCWTSVQVNEYKLNRWKHEPLQQKWWQRGIEHRFHAVIVEEIWGIPML
jgi:hypothetical protein